jgi:hypothetical protein
VEFRAGDPGNAIEKSYAGFLDEWNSPPKGYFMIERSSGRYEGGKPHDEFLESCANSYFKG